MKLFERLKTVFNKNKKQKTKEEKDLYVGSYVVLELNKNILSQLQQNNCLRYDSTAFDEGVIKGIIKAIYVDDLGKQYAEILSVSEPGKYRDYPVYFHEINKIITSVK